MASLEKIRNRSGLLIGFIGVALAAFVLGDLFSSGNRLFGGNQHILGEVNGDVIEQQEFEVELQEVTGLQGPNANQSDIRAGLWNDKVNQLILNSEYNKSGISMTADELAGITIGLNNHEIDPVVKQIFGIQPGQEVTSQQLGAYLNQLQTQDPKRWTYIQGVIQKQRLSSKFNTLMANSYIATTAEAEAFYMNSGKTASGSYVYKSYASVDEANQTVTDADLKAYYDAHKSEFERSESRRVQYAIFDIVPSAEDNAEIRTAIEALKNTQTEYNKKFSVIDTIPGFATTENMDGFLREHSDVYFDPAFKAKGQLPATFDEIMHTNEIGFVYGPYFEAGSYKMARLMDKRNDSVQVAVLVMDVVSSDNTDNMVFKKASAFAMSLENSSYDESIKTLDAGGKAYEEVLTQDDRQTGGLGSDKQLMRWAFKSTREAGEITRFTMNGKYVVARLDAKLPKGFAAFEDIKEQLTPAAKLEKAKAYLLSELQGTSTLQDAASKLGEEVKTFSGLAFASNTLEGAGGYEPIVVGAIMGLPTNTVSSPISGTSGIVIAEVASATEPAASNDYKAIQSQIENAFIPRVSYELTPALREQADVKDLRADFY